MRIAIDVRAATRQPSGVGIYTRTLVAALARREEDDRYLLLSNRPVQLETQLPDNFDVLDQPYPIGNLWLQTHCPTILRRQNIDVFHGTNFLAPLRGSCPVVLTIHDLSSFLFPELHTWRNNLVQRSLPWMIKRAARIIAISENTKRDLISHLHAPEEKIRVVHNACPPCFEIPDDRATRERIKRELHLPERYFLFVGTLEPRKNLGFLLEAFARFTERNAGATKLVLAGTDGWGSQEIRAKHQRLGLGERVVFTGYIEQSKLPAVYRGAQALIMPSVYEGFGLPLVEAMTCGTPVVAAANSALPEVVGDAAVLVDNHDVQQLAEMLVLIDQDETVRIKHSQAGLELAKRFRLDNFAAATYEVYREAVESQR